MQEVTAEKYLVWTGEEYPAFSKALRKAWRESGVQLDLSCEKMRELAVDRTPRKPRVLDQEFVNHLLRVAPPDMLPWLKEMLLEKAPADLLPWLRERLQAENSPAESVVA